MRKEIPCPLCKSEEFELLNKINTIDNKYYLKKCKKCNLTFINPLPDLAELGKYYNSDYEVPLYQQKKVKQKTKKILDILNKKNINKIKDVYDIGASYGFFLKEARKKGWAIHGLELSKKAHKIAKQKYNIDLENKPIERSSLFKKNKKYDLVTMLDVIEHLRAPAKIIKEISKKIKKGGYFIATTPNIDSIEYKKFGKYWEWISPPAHIFYFNPKTIKALFEKNGFEIEHLETYRGDSAGNLLFHKVLALRRKIFYNIDKIIGRKKAKKLKEKLINKTHKSNTQQKNEFEGVMGILKKTTELLYPIIKKKDQKRNNQGKGATILVVAKKK